MGIVLMGLGRPAAAAESAASDAYELRMQGKVDQARSLLEETLAEAPDDAAARYELARTRMHMALGNPKDLEQDFADVKKLMEQAVAHDPQKVMYLTFAGHTAFGRAYFARMTGKPNVKDDFLAACNAFEAALKLKPDNPQVMLYLVELHAKFPEDAGADKSKAESYAGQLQGVDDLYAAKAKSILSPESCGVEFWKAFLSENEPENADVLEELGKAHLREDQVDEAVKCFEQAIQRDPSKTYLFLDLSIYHTFRAMRAGKTDKGLFQKSVAAGDAAISRYLDSEPIRPMQAYALGVQAKYRFFSGEKEQGQEFIERAEALDPYFSKATGAPAPDQFIPPDEVSRTHRYLTRPF
jgi:tetratricopeptide (TPR) repeat protein